MVKPLEMSINLGPGTMRKPLNVLVKSLPPSTFSLGTFGINQIWTSGKQLFRFAALVPAGPTPGVPGNVVIPHGASIDELIDFQSILKCGGTFHLVGNGTYNMQIDATNVTLSTMATNLSACAGFVYFSFTKV